MKLFMCFGGAAAVIDDEAAEVAARHRGLRHGRRSLSFRRKFLPGYKGGNEKKPSEAPALAESKKRGVDADDDVDVYGVYRASSVASSALLSSASSLDSDTSASSSSRSSTASSPPSVSGVLYPPPVKRQASDNKRPASSPAAGAAAVVLCLLMVVFCGRVGATLLTSTALYLFPWRWPAARTTHDKEKKGAVDSLECDAAASASEAEEEETAKRNKVVMEGSLVGNRKQVK